MICISLADIGEGCGGCNPPPPLDGKFNQRRSLLGLQPPPPLPHQKFLDPPMYTQKVDICRNTKGYYRPTEHSVTIKV